MTCMRPTPDAYCHDGVRRKQVVANCSDQESRAMVGKMNHVGGDDVGRRWAHARQASAVPVAEHASCGDIFDCRRPAEGTHALIFLRSRDARLEEISKVVPEPIMVDHCMRKRPFPNRDRPQQDDARNATSSQRLDSGAQFLKIAIGTPHGVQQHDIRVGGFDKAECGLVHFITMRI
jgi:hypothetical protein